MLSRFVAMSCLAANPEDDRLIETLTLPPPLFYHHPVARSRITPGKANATPAAPVNDLPLKTFKTALDSHARVDEFTLFAGRRNHMSRCVFQYFSSSRLESNL
ncbi:hypothetical protein KCP70_03290 [Salmonella enterica subsp. enterica]|nr:hypothetical protein KCP70_03290 [Salmonella enterica subsp. enterica]